MSVCVCEREREYDFVHICVCVKRVAGIGGRQKNLCSK